MGSPGQPRDLVGARLSAAPPYSAPLGLPSGAVRAGRGGLPFRPGWVLGGRVVRGCGTQQLALASASPRKAALSLTTGEEADDAFRPSRYSGRRVGVAVRVSAG